MRKVLGARSVLSLFIAGAVGVWTACGGTEVGLTEEDAGVDTEVPDTGPPKDEPDAAAPDSGSDAGKTADPYDAGPPMKYDGAPLCVVGGEVEEEPNDTREEADTLRPTRCGIAHVFGGASDAGDDAGDADDAGDDEDAGDAGPEKVGPESDFLTFELGEDAKKFYVQYAGDVSVIIETEGQPPIDIAKNPSATLRFAKGQPYYIEVRSATGKSEPWRVTLFEE